MFYGPMIADQLFHAFSPQESGGRNPPSRIASYSSFPARLPPAGRRRAEVSSCVSHGGSLRAELGRETYVPRVAQGVMKSFVFLSIMMIR